MTHDEIFTRVAGVLEQMFEIDPARITLDARLYDDLDIDSIDAVDLLVKMKPLMSRPIRAEQFKSVKTVGDVVRTLASLIDSPATA
ncbi:acyl carrier protein [Cupriavidus metallidurans]|jgi:acyl carrier protein|uniref:Acyl-carrier-protein n=2 Tax=Cupriavidus metallidurans TaxID=119219 RepID=Q1LF32_CUPMC|nr:MULTISPECIES: acyl carrier protein [Cupriavidus]ABF11244.1 acyl-carrier-protein [Cupriavidus metallidurans CH34]AVA34611.1 acyl carrier protein [Cupriavidus metallidurans]EKZ95402.1 acyl carrier protein [Cupriavidus sp. HMR-1]KWR82534.1 acyl carrier protein [Cupriavidus sp. SHE]KWW39264.1 Acyl carrier protein [Cupriavidus metallidurans]